jgi:NAD(P)-dependent dehydrogenase (short-subunit alcohol dehydrogenase family)
VASDLSGRVAVVTGGGTGIGAGIVAGLAGAGASVAIGYRTNAAGADALAERLRDRSEVLTQRCDVRNFDEVQTLFDATLTRFGRVDVLVNNAGITDPKPLLEMTPDDWDRTLETNLRGTFFCSQRAAREMIARGDGGRIVNIGSIHGFAAAPNHAHYEASKGGINMLTKACAVEWAPHDIQVNVVAPGAIEVERYAQIADYDPQAWGRAIPAGRVGTPDDVAPIVVFLASESARYITGQIIWVDGGLSSQISSAGR